MVSVATWIAFKAWYKKAWVWCKTNWKLFLGMAIPIALYLITRKPVDSKKIIEKIRGDHEKEIDVIERAHDKELATRDEAIAKYLDAIEQIETEYEKSSRQLDKEKKKYIRELRKGTSGDPELITKEIEKLTGIKIYITE